MGATTDRATVQALFETWMHQVHEGERWDLVPACIAPLQTRHERGVSRQVTPQGYADELRALHQDRRDWRVQVHDVAIAGDRCWQRSTWTFTDLKTGQRQTMADLGVWRVEGGRFAEVWGWPRTGPGAAWPEYQPGLASASA